MKYNKGFTQIEVIVVCLIISILSIGGIETIINFQKKAILDNTARELISTIRIAQNNSLAGKIQTSESPNDFSPDGLPKYGVFVNNNSYSLFRDFEGVGVGNTRQILEVIQIDDRLEFTSTAEVVFNRITGTSSPVDFTLKQRNNSEVLLIKIDQTGLITKIE